MSPETDGRTDKFVFTRLAGTGRALSHRHAHLDFPPPSPPSNLLRLLARILNLNRAAGRKPEIVHEAVSSYECAVLLPVCWLAAVLSRVPPNERRSHKLLGRQFRSGFHQANRSGGGSSK